MSEHMKLWNAMCTPPASALKKIQGGRLSGKSDINPQWRWQVLTETFGPVGFGWNFETVQRWTERGEGIEVMVFVHLRMKVKKDGEWSEWVEGMGGSMLVVQEKGGPYNDDEAWKKAYTDALGNAAKYFGVAADVFLGMMDGSKYAPRSPANGNGSGNGATPTPVGGGDAERISKAIKEEIKSAPSLDALMGNYNAILASGLPRGLQDELVKECTSRRKEIEKKEKRGATA